LAAIAGTEESPIGVAVVEDHPAFRFALEQLVSRNPRFKLVGSFPDGASALEALRDSPELVALVDVELPELDGISLLRSLSTGNSKRALVLSAHTDGATVRAALTNGATGYLTKGAEVDEIEDALIATSEGRTVLCSSAQQALADLMRAESPDETLLTVRETDVLELAASGMTRSDIGDELHLSEATVKAHLAAAYHKLGVANRAAAIAEAQRRGLTVDRRRSFSD